MFALEKKGLLDDLTFQGGTLLRLCHGSSRFSEDLDFAGGRDFVGQHVAAIGACIEDYVSSRYQLEVHIREPTELRSDPDYDGVTVDKWQVSVVTSPARPDIPQAAHQARDGQCPGLYQRAAYAQRELSIPSGWLPGFACHVRHRDIWDLQWLKQRGVSPDVALVSKKLADYSVEGYPANARDMQARLPEIIGSGVFKNEMARFLPAAVLERTLYEPKFIAFLERETRALLDRVVEELEARVRTAPITNLGCDLD